VKFLEFKMCKYLKLKVEIWNLYVKCLEFEILKIKMFEFVYVNTENWKLKFLYEMSRRNLKFWKLKCLNAEN